MPQFCIHCGARLQDKTRFCIACGKLVIEASNLDIEQEETKEEPRSPEPTVAKKKKRPHRFQFAAMLLLLVGGLLAGCYFYLTAYRPELIANIKTTILGGTSLEQFATAATDPSGSGLTTAQLRAQWAERALQEGRLADAETELRQAEALEPESKVVRDVRAKLQAVQEVQRRAEEERREAERRAEEGRLQAENEARQRAEEARRQEEYRRLEQEAKRLSIPYQKDNCFDLAWYATLPDYKAIAVGYLGVSAPRMGWFCGSGQGYSSQYEANQEALRKCRDSQDGNFMFKIAGEGAKGRCEIYAEGSKLVYGRMR